MKLYKGTTKKWQVLDDAVFDRDQIEKLQAAIHAPSPAQLEAWKEKHDVPMKLPATNQNVAAWRDESLAVESADFDPALLTEQRKQKKNEYLGRFEAPKELH